MSATENHVKEQCKRLSSVPMIEPKTPEGKREIKEALLRNCQSDEHVTEVVTFFLEGESGVNLWNPVAALVQIARNTRRLNEAPPGCDRCALGPDEFTGEMRWMPHVAVDCAEYSFAIRCPGPIGGPACERGNWLRARDLEAGKSKPSAKAKHEHKTDVDWQRRAAGDAE